MRCGVCGAGLVRSATKSPSGKRYDFWRCSSALSGHVTVSDRKVTPPVLSEALTRLSAYMKTNPGTYVAAEVPEELTDALDLAQSEIEELDRQLADSEIPATIYSKAMSKAVEDRDRLQAEVDGLESDTRKLYRSSDLEVLSAAQDVFIALTEHLDTSGELSDTLDALGYADNVPAVRNVLKRFLGPVTIRPASEGDERILFQAA
ncbi:MAG: hypothetical protein H0U46_08150 [Actinobacteria bacterium]|nr:hypothetical protein [Actinomycetota bacterium]